MIHAAQARLSGGLRFCCRSVLPSSVGFSAESVAISGAVNTFAAGIASIALGYWFNIHFVLAAHGQGNLISGPASYPTFLREQFANPAAGSGNQDYMIANVILMPVFTIVDGLRRGIRRPWLFFLSSFFTSFAFPFAFYFATMERQRRHEQARQAVAA